MFCQECDKRDTCKEICNLLEKYLQKEFKMTRYQIHKYQKTFILMPPEKVAYLKAVRDLRVRGGTDTKKEAADWLGKQIRKSR